MPTSVFMDTVRFFGEIIGQVFGVYSYIVFARIILNWLPGFNINDAIFNVISSLADPYLERFRRLIPPIGDVDVSTIAAILVLQSIERIIDNINMYLMYI
uniref:YGGT family, conserved hypothetical integral membrane protein n=1 Tax=Paulinella chromatophora TaxID=39717 RepID=B1X3V6_PAUCH|nr:YGGT family, conserved hypothetical integral membrane protein [Paulinella chromatophora]ACB42625.1 YGGT family, conserved hypothetical integral membrane protein [Paulinella chromatophora]